MTLKLKPSKQNKLLIELDQNKESKRISYIENFVNQRIS
jgi:uncharacterized protein YdeI (YjbR/CyaY-like superfamily)